MFDIIQHRGNGLIDVALKEVRQRHRMHNNFSGRGSLRTFSGCRAGNKFMSLIMTEKSHITHQDILVTNIIALANLLPVAF